MASSYLPIFTTIFTKLVIKSSSYVYRYKFAQKGAGSIPIGMPIACLIVMLPTVKKQFFIKCLTATMSELLEKYFFPLVLLHEGFPFSDILTYQDILS